MRVNNENYLSIWVDDNEQLKIINQLSLPHKFEVTILHNFEEVVASIKNMLVRGAGLIGVTAGYGMWLLTKEAPKNSIDSFESYIENHADRLRLARPTASNLAWAVNRQINKIKSGSTIEEKINLARNEAIAIAEEDRNACYQIGQYGLEILRNLSIAKPGKVINILTHCNAGWLAFVDYGTALSPIFLAHDEGIPVHVWVDETRPRNQGASLTAWELATHGVSHSLIVDNAGGHLMQHGMVDVVFTGADRVTLNGDVANKIGTYLKALAANDNNVPFYVAFPSSTIDFTLNNFKQIPIEERSGDEVRNIMGKLNNGDLAEVQICPDLTPARNWAFDVTPSYLITGLICERGVCPPSKFGLQNIFPEEFNE